ncbi:MAG TPA: L,D-transpeptidase family protein [Aestuariivirga sp.]|nr:L,D-transpeptidase family protein [Aestuariivirga sp.]
MRLILRSLSILLFLLAGQQTYAGKNDRVPNYEDVSAALAEILNSPERQPLPIERIREALKAHYLGNGGSIYWVGTGRMTPFIQRLEDAQFDGLNPDDYPVDTLIDVRDSVDPDDPRSAAQAELYYSAFFVAYAADLKIGRVAPQKVDPRLFRSRKSIDVLRVLTELNRQRNPGTFLSSFEPHNEHYQALKKMMRVYSTQADEGGWPVIEQGPALKAGMSDPRVPKIRSLLALTGDYEWQVTNSPVYDERLVIAVQRFQQRHGLEAKGLIGKQSIIAMDVTPEDRISQIILNMERWRWMPDTLGQDHFLVNLAAFELQRVQSSVIVERMDVVVGAIATQTPEFSDEMEYVELNPTWTVPYSIATQEMLPKLRSNPFAYAGDFDVFVNGALSSWGSINWDAYGPGKFPFTFRQRPGPKNALGKVKFMLPNKHNIYLHDTPSKDKFASTSRAFSHGCIRLSRPIELAHTVIREVPGWSDALVDGVLASGKLTRVSLPNHIPVHLVYSTAFKGENGIEFRPDVYGRDRKLYSALFGRPTS